MSKHPETSTPLRRSLLISFTLPTLILGFMHGPEGQIQAIYAKHAGIALGALSVALLLSKILDAITYPLIGYLSDRSYARSGTRRHWIIAGCMLSMLGVWFLFRPPGGVGIVYFGCWMTVTYIGWKLMEIPLQAWSYGLSTDYAQRSRVQAWRVLSLLAGTLLFFVSPYLAMQLGHSDSSELDFRSLGLAAVICVVALPIATLLTVIRVPAGQAAAPPAQRRHSIAETWRALRGNAPLLRLLAAFLPMNLLAMLATSTSYLYFDIYLGLGKQFPALMALSLLASLGGVPFWSAMGARHERHRVWAASLALGGLACLGFAFLAPGALALPVSFVLYPIVAFCLSAVVLVFTMSADIVDLEILQSGEDLSGLYGSLLYFLQKSLGGVSAAAGIALAAAFGFEPTAAVQSAGGVLGIKLVAAALPAAGLFLAGAIIWNYPLDRARVEHNATELKQKQRAVRV